MFMTAVLNGSNDDDRLAPLGAGKIIQPGIFQRLLDHGLRYHPGVSIVPTAAQIRNNIRVDPRYSRFLSTTDQRQQYKRHDSDSSPIHSHAIPPRGFGN